MTQSRQEYVDTLRLMSVDALHAECVLRHTLDLRRGGDEMPSWQWDACLDECMRRGIASSAWQAWREEARAEVAKRDRPDPETVRRLLT